MGSHYLFESLADFLRLELTAEMLKLGVGELSLANNVLRRLLPVVPEQHKTGLRGGSYSGYCSLVYHVPDPPSRDFEASKV